MTGDLIETFGSTRGGSRLLTAQPAFGEFS